MNRLSHLKRNAEATRSIVKSAKTLIELKIKTSTVKKFISKYHYNLHILKADKNYVVCNFLQFILIRNVYLSKIMKKKNVHLFIDVLSNWTWIKIKCRFTNHNLNKVSNKKKLQKSQLSYFLLEAIHYTKCITNLIKLKLNV